MSNNSKKGTGGPGIFGLLLIFNIAAMMIVGSGTTSEFFRLITLVVLTINIVIFSLGVYFVTNEDDD